MPRSGTSLAEQILSAHKDVYGAGELKFLGESIKKNFLKVSQKTFLEKKISSMNSILLTPNSEIIFTSSKTESTDLLK